MTCPQLCAHCQYRPVRTRATGGKARYCSDRCQSAELHARKYDEAEIALNHLRFMLHLPAGSGSVGAAEARRMAQRVADMLGEPLPVRRGRAKVYAEHGTQRRYKQGCSCAACRAAETAYRHELKARHEAERAAAGAEITPLPGHSERAA